MIMWLQTEIFILHSALLLSLKIIYEQTPSVRRDERLWTEGKHFQYFL